MSEGNGFPLQGAREFPRDLSAEDTLGPCETNVL